MSCYETGDVNVLPSRTHNYSRKKGEFEEQSATFTLAKQRTRSASMTRRLPKQNASLALSLLFRKPKMTKEKKTDWKNRLICLSSLHSTVLDICRGVFTGLENSRLCSIKIYRQSLQPYENHGEN